MKKPEYNPIEFIETLETWEGGKASGYYNHLANEIHVLRGDQLEFRTLLHERFHAQRRDKLTFQLAALIQTPATTTILFSVFVVLSIFGAFQMSLGYGGWLNLVPSFFIAALITFLLGCVAYEEYLADVTVIKSCKAIKENGGGENSK